MPRVTISGIILYNSKPQYFSPTLPNPVSCRIANEVIYEIDRKKLQRNALKTGLFLKAGLKNLSKKIFDYRKCKRKGVVYRGRVG